MARAVRWHDRQLGWSNKPSTPGGPLSHPLHPSLSCNHAVVEACREEPEALAIFRPAVLCCYLRCIGETAPHHKLEVAVRRIKEVWARQARQARQAQRVEKAREAEQGLIKEEDADWASGGEE